jgi:hypothetical protein
MQTTFEQAKAKAAIEFDNLWPRTSPKPSDDVKEAICDLMAYYGLQCAMAAQWESKPHR